MSETPTLTNAPLIARMVAEAEQRGFDRGVNATFDTDGALIEAGRRALREAADELAELREIDGRPDYRAGPGECANWLRARADEVTP